MELIRPVHESEETSLTFTLQVSPRWDVSRSERVRTWQQAKETWREVMTTMGQLAEGQRSRTRGGLCGGGGYAQTRAKSTGRWPCHTLAPLGGIVGVCTLLAVSGEKMTMSRGCVRSSWRVVPRGWILRGAVRQGQTCRVCA